jgi:hypothetical protein
MNSMVLETSLEYIKTLLVVSLNDCSTLLNTELGAGQFTSENI